MEALYLFMCFCSCIVGYQVRHMECFMRHILHSVEHDAPEHDPAKEARYRRLLLLISISMTVGSYGILILAMSTLFRDVQEQGRQSWHGILVMLIGLLAGRFYYNVKLARKLKGMTAEQRQEEFGDGPALLTRQQGLSERGMRNVASHMPVQDENSNAWLIYAISGIVLVVGIVCFFLALFGG